MDDICTYDFSNVTNEFLQSRRSSERSSVFRSGTKQQNMFGRHQCRNHDTLDSYTISNNITSNAERGNFDSVNNCTRLPSIYKNIERSLADNVSNSRSTHAVNCCETDTNRNQPNDHFENGYINTFVDNLERIKSLYFINALTRNICYRTRQNANCPIPCVCVSYSGNVHFYLYKDVFVEMSIDGSLSCVSIRNHSITIVGSSDEDFLISNSIVNLAGHKSLLMAERCSGQKAVLDQHNKNISVNSKSAYNIDQHGDVVKVKESSMYFDCLLRDIFIGRKTGSHYVHALRDLVRASRFTSISPHLIRIQVGIVNIYQNLESGRVFVELKNRYQITVDPYSYFVRLSTLNAFVQIDHDGKGVRAKSNNGKVLLKDYMVAVRSLNFLACLDINTECIRVEKFNNEYPVDLSNPSSYQPKDTEDKTVSDTFSFKSLDKNIKNSSSFEKYKEEGPYCGGTNMTYHQVLYVPPGIRRKLENRMDNKNVCLPKPGLNVFNNFKPKTNERITNDLSGMSSDRQNSRTDTHFTYSNKTPSNFKGSNTVSDRFAVFQKHDNAKHILPKRSTLFTKIENVDYNSEQSRAYQKENKQNTRVIETKRKKCTYGRVRRLIQLFEEKSRGLR
ncbi:hypothetical protein GJ496_001396 [Pomphorhynchus laevis]|nr:hypothetical protein GJ496_001396 [Pomphorhynchus laevis]